MTVSVKIIRSINVGSGISFHTDYLLEISMNGRNWSIYRRYSAFEDLHKRLSDEMGGEPEFMVKFADKVYIGSYFSTLSVLTSARIISLQQYIDSITVIEDAFDSKALTDFLDCNHLGLSGIVKELGGDRVLKEAFISTRITKSLPEVLGLWCLRFVVLLSSGSLVILNSVYDDSSKALTRMALVAGQTTVIPQANTSNTIVIASALDKSKISLSFSTQAESVFWLRKLSDFVSNAEFSADHRKNAESARQQQAAAEKSRQEQLLSHNQEHIRAKGTGHTEDDLSKMLGI